MIAAFQGEDGLSIKAIEILADPERELLADPEREFIISEYLKLETLPKPTFYNRNEEIEFLKGYFSQAAHSVEATNNIVEQSIKIASQYDLTPIDSLHMSSALTAQVDEFITLEKREKPMFRMNEITIISIRE